MHKYMFQCKDDVIDVTFVAIIVTYVTCTDSMIVTIAIIICTEYIAMYIIIAMYSIIVM